MKGSFLSFLFSSSTGFLALEDTVTGTSARVKTTHLTYAVAPIFFFLFLFLFLLSLTRTEEHPFYATDVVCQESHEPPLAK